MNQFTTQELQLIFEALYHLSVSDDLADVADKHNLSDDDAEQALIALKTKVDRQLAKLSYKD